MLLLSTPGNGYLEPLQKTDKPQHTYIHIYIYVYTQIYIYIYVRKQLSSRASSPMEADDKYVALRPTSQAAERSGWMCSGATVDQIKLDQQKLQLADLVVETESNIQTADQCVAWADTDQLQKAVLT